MDLASVISLIVVAVVAVFSSITAPLILARRTERMHREDQLADYQRQDEVARRAAEAAAALLGQQRLAAEAARVRDEAAKQLAAATARRSDDKLDVIHGLVNSTLSAALVAELDALVTSLAMMKEVMDLKRAAGHEPTREAQIALRATEAKVAEIRATLADRLNQAETIAGRAAVVATAAKDAAKAAEAKARPLLNPAEAESLSDDTPPDPAAAAPG